MTVYIYEDDGTFQATENAEYANQFAIDTPPEIIVGIGCTEDEARHDYMLRKREAEVMRHNTR